MQACGWLRLKTPTGLHQLLGRLGIHLKRARQHVHSPDANYVHKLRDVRISLGERISLPKESVLLFQDELTYYRRPTLASAYELAGAGQPLAEQGYSSNKSQRVIATLDALTGQVIHEQMCRTSIDKIVGFYQRVCEAYEGIGRIYLVQDNWPVHYHPDVLAALEPQETRWPGRVPPNWPKEASEDARKIN